MFFGKYKSVEDVYQEYFGGINSEANVAKSFPEHTAVVFAFSTPSFSAIATGYEIPVSMVLFLYQGQLHLQKESLVMGDAPTWDPETTDWFRLWKQRHDLGTLQGFPSVISEWLRLLTHNCTLRVEPSYDSETQKISVRHTPAARSERAFILVPEAILEEKDGAN